MNAKRRLSAAFCSAVLITTVPALAQVPLPLPAVADHLGTPDRDPIKTTLANGVTSIPGVAYAEPAGFRRLTLDLYVPPQSVQRPSAGFPLVVFLHGGAFLGGNAERLRPFVDFPGVLASLSSKGYVVASVEYRLSGEAKFPAPIQDVKTAIRWLRLHASAYDIDPARVVTWGVSAGGYLAALAAVSCNVTSLEPAPAKSVASYAEASVDTGSAIGLDCVQGSVAWYGIFDLSTIAAQATQRNALPRDSRDAPEWRMLGCFASECDAQQIATASPVTYVDAKTPPMLLIAGDADALIPYDQTLEMAEKLKSANAEHELLVLPGVDHSFMGKTAQQTSEANLKALEATFAFIDRTVGTASTAR